MDDRLLIEQLGVPHRATAAYRALLALGFAVVPAAREGLRHSNADVRYRCCGLLDRYLVAEVCSDLVAMLDDPDGRVRQAALHTFACDRCKEGECQLLEADVLPAALRILKEDRDTHVRAMAIEVVGRYVHTNPVAEQALIHAQGNDPSPAVRKKAGWYAAGGPIYVRTVPRTVREQ
jgi:hypothetical protein